MSCKSSVAHMRGILSIYTAHHHDNKSFEMAIHRIKAPIPVAIGILYD
jgi:hypothetical protein